MIATKLFGRCPICEQPKVRRHDGTYGCRDDRHMQAVQPSKLTVLNPTDIIVISNEENEDTMTDFHLNQHLDRLDKEAEYEDERPPSRGTVMIAYHRFHGAVSAHLVVSEITDAFGRRLIQYMSDGRMHYALPDVDYIDGYPRMIVGLAQVDYGDKFMAALQQYWMVHRAWEEARARKLSVRHLAYQMGYSYELGGESMELTTIVDDEYIEAREDARMLSEQRNRAIQMMTHFANLVQQQLDKLIVEEE